MLTKAKHQAISRNLRLIAWCFAYASNSLEEI
jgi:hypothetical protein